jgi:hypothetical protein
MTSKVETTERNKKINKKRCWRERKEQIYERKRKGEIKQKNTA